MSLACWEIGITGQSPLLPPGGKWELLILKERNSGANGCIDLGLLSIESMQKELCMQLWRKYGIFLKICCFQVAGSPPQRSTSDVERPGFLQVACGCRDCLLFFHQKLVCFSFFLFLFVYPCSICYLFAHFFLLSDNSILTCKEVMCVVTWIAVCMWTKPPITLETPVQSQAHAVSTIAQLQLAKMSVFMRIHTVC